MRKRGTSLSELQTRVGDALEKLGYDRETIEDEMKVAKLAKKSDSKTERLVKWVEDHLFEDGELRDDERLLVFTEYKETLFYLEERFKQVPLKAAFMVRDLAAWEQPKPPIFEYDRRLIPLFSPRSKSLPEVRTREDLRICETIYEHAIRIGDANAGWTFEYHREFDLTNDSRLFPAITKWKKNGFERDVFGRWLGPNGEVALPLYEGRMIGQFDVSEKGWVSGKGRSANWRDKGGCFDHRLEPFHNCRHLYVWKVSRSRNRSVYTP